MRVMTSPTDLARPRVGEPDNQLTDSTPAQRVKSGSVPDGHRDRDVGERGRGSVTSCAQFGQQDQTLLASTAACPFGHSLPLKVADRRAHERLCEVTGINRSHTLPISGRVRPPWPPEQRRLVHDEARADAGCARRGDEGDRPADAVSNDDGRNT